MNEAMEQRSMPPEKTPALIVVIVLANKQQWFVAGISLVDGSVDTLVRSEIGNLDAYIGAGPDEQLSFLRHRLSGAMQRGFDRLWGKHAKAARIVLIADQDLPEAAPDLLPKLAAHLDTWMTRPPITFLRGAGHEQIESLDELECLVGPLEASEADQLRKGLPRLKQLMASGEAWEIIPKPSE